MRCEDKKKMRCKDEKMFYRPPILEEAYAQTLSEIKFYFLIIFKNNLNIFILFKLIPNILYKTIFIKYTLLFLINILYREII